MRRLIPLLLWLATCGVALAQSYPSPTYNNLTVRSNLVAASGGSTPITIQNGEISTTGLLTFYASAGPGFSFNGPGGIGVLMNAPSSAVTGRLNIAAGTSNAPITFTAANSTNPNQGFAFQAASGVGSQIALSAPGMTGAFSAPPTTPYNCAGNSGYVIICQTNETLNGGGPLLLNVVHQFGGAGTTGGRVAFNASNILYLPTSDTSNSFYQAGNFTGAMSANAGGTSTLAAGSNFAFASVARLENGATHFTENAGTEIDLSIEAGASAEKLHGSTVVLLSQNAVAPSVEATGYSVGAETGAVPTIRCAFCVGREDGYNALASNAAVMALLPNTYTGAYGSTISDGVDLRLGTFTNAAFETNGGSWNGSSFRLGHTYFTDGPSGLTINPAGSVATGATVAAGGSGYVVPDLTHPGPLNAMDTHGGIWQLGVSGGAVTSVTMLVAPTVSGATPSNPLALTSMPGQPGSGATINIASWTTGSSEKVTGTVIAGGFQVTPVTTASLPTCNSTSKGMWNAVTDANAVTYNSTVAGGGSNILPVFCNGTNWTEH